MLRCYQLNPPALPCWFSVLLSHRTRWVIRGFPSHGLETGKLMKIHVRASFLTCVQVLAAEMLRNAERLVDQRLHPQILIKGYRQALKARCGHPAHFGGALETRETPPKRLLPEVVADGRREKSVSQRSAARKERAVRRCAEFNGACHCIFACGVAGRRSTCDACRKSRQPEPTAGCDGGAREERLRPREGHGEVQGGPHQHCEDHAFVGDANPERGFKIFDLVEIGNIVCTAYPLQDLVLSSTCVHACTRTAAEQRRGSLV